MRESLFGSLPLDLLESYKAGKEKLAYKAKNALERDEMRDFLPSKINQGDQIPIVGFYKLFGDGNKNFVDVFKF